MLRRDESGMRTIWHKPRAQQASAQLRWCRNTLGIAPCIAPCIALGIALDMTGAAPVQAEEAQHFAPVSIRALFKRNDSVDPDEPKLKYETVGGRWRAMAGGHLGIYGVHTPSLTFATSISGFIQLINLDDEQPVPWETFRANVGINTFWASRALSRALLPAGGRLLGELGWFHESDHVANERAFRSRFLRDSSLLDEPARFDNGDLSSYEYFKLRLGYQQTLGRLTTVFSGGLRIFTPSINSGAKRELEYGLQTQGRVDVQLTASLHLWTALYLESLTNDFDGATSGFARPERGAPLLYRTLHIGMSLRDDAFRVASLYLVYNRSNGRGINFTERYGDELGVGISGAF